MSIETATAGHRDADLPWSVRNQRWLVARFADLRARIAGTRHSSLDDGDASSAEFGPAALHCAALFGLSAFERDLLLLCAGVALDDALAKAVATAGGRADGQPSFAFAMSVLDDPHWDALSPQSPLRYWQLLHVDGPMLAHAPLRIDERVMHYLAGVPAMDERLDGLVEQVGPPDPAPDTPAWVVRAAGAFARGSGCVELQRSEGMVTRDDVAALLAALGRPALWVHELPAEAGPLANVLRLLDREAALSSAVVVLDTRHVAARTDLAVSLLRSQAILLASRDAPRTSGIDTHVPLVSLPMEDASARAQALIERSLRHGARLPAAALQEAAIEACEQFRPPHPRALEDAARLLAAASDAREACTIAWQSLRQASRENLDRLAQHVPSTATPDDLVLPAAQAAIIAEIGRQLRHRRRVHRDWGFASNGPRGLGIAALFAGESGTGKTMAAEAIANAAGLDLFRVDLAGTVSKYIGETEKNLRRIFDAAEASGAVLLFDEADALFGKRGEVKDSHDRYANIETAYLLQRIESYRGLAILTTNVKSAIDKAFLRRIRFLVQFPFPDEAAREALWRRQFPPQAPLSDDIRWDALSRLHLAGGHIRAIALNAAFRASHEDAPIAHRHLLAAAHAELAKLERNPGQPHAGARS